VDGEGPDELWLAFRVGARGRVTGGVTRRSAGGTRVFRGAVLAPKGWAHERGIVFSPGRWLVVFDRVYGQARGAQVRLRIPLAAGIDVVANRLTGPTSPLELAIAKGQLAGREAGTEGRGFGVALPRTALVLAPDPDGRAVWGLGTAGLGMTIDGRCCTISSPLGSEALELDQNGLPT
jgi:hypothetical protein